MSDEELLQLSYKKPLYFGELFDRHNKRFLRISQRALRSKEDAEDVVQEAFIRIYKYGKKFPQNGGRFGPWANTILKNCIADQINKYKKSTVSLTEEIENTSPELITPAEESLATVGLSPAGELGNKNVQIVLGKMGGSAAEIINLRYVLGKSFKEISKILHIKNSTARVRVYRSKKMFLEAYKQFDGFQYD
jgi:RNA polymerase sigma-70 factor (ECF subfamily)